MKTKRFLASILLIGLAASYASCGEAAGSADTTGGVDSVSETEAAVVLPDYGGETFNILIRTQYAHEFAVDEESGDLLNDAVYQRNLAVEQAYNVDITTYEQPCTYGSEATRFNNLIQSSVLAGSGEYDLIAGYAATIPALVGENLFLNWLEADIIDFSQPWWSQKVADELTINGKAYMITGDISVALWENMNTILFNKRIAGEYKVGDLYQVVKDGKWTIDKVNELSELIYDDLNNDGKRGIEDSYGFIWSHGAHTDMMLDAFDIHVTVKGEDGFPEFSLINERTLNAHEKLLSMIEKNQGVFFSNGVKNYETVLSQMFSEGRGMLLTTRLSETVILRGMNDDFGILPYPKLDEAQEDYYSTSRDQFSVFMIPADAKDPEMTAHLTDALCKESYEQVIPTFYEVVLKTKGARDNESQAMIDMIRDGLVFNFGYLHSTAMGSVGHLFAKQLRAGDGNLASAYAANENVYNEKLQTILAPYR